MIPNLFKLYAKDVGKNLPLMALNLALSKDIDDLYRPKDLIFMRNCCEFSTDRVKFGKFLKTEIMSFSKLIKLSLSGKIVDSITLSSILSFAIKQKLI